MKIDPMAVVSKPFASPAATIAARTHAHIDVEVRELASLDPFLERVQRSELVEGAERSATGKRDPELAACPHAADVRASG